MKRKLLTIVCFVFTLAITACARRTITSREQQNPDYQTVSFDTNGGSEIPSQQVKHGEKITKPDNPVKEGYDFVNWTYQGEEWSFLGHVVTEDMTLLANWNARFGLTITSEDEERGTVSIVGGNKYPDPGSSVTVEATPLSGFAFVGWFNNGDCISSEASYSFIMQNENYSLSARFLTNEEKMGITPYIDLANKTVTYGLYPQNSSSGLSSSATLLENGYYFSDNQYFAKKVVDKKTFLYKCEPIKWKILSIENGEYHLISNQLLEEKLYHNSEQSRTIDGNDIYGNNYQYSDIRTWLNGEFYSQAFGLNDSYLKTVNVDNHTSVLERYRCDDTKDKVYLLSQKEYLNPDYFVLCIEIRK